jgi:FKBP-type peptidyl-prolyl cis-trans isomerase FkpA
MKNLGILLFWLIIQSCTTPEKHPGFKEVEPGLFIKLISFEHESLRNPETQCYIYECYFKMIADDTLRQSFHDDLPGWITQDDIRLETLKDFLGYLNEGDSAVFIDERQQLNTDSATQIYLSLHRCFSPESFNVHYAKWLNLREMNEQKRIADFVSGQGFTNSLVQPAVWYRIDVSGTGNPLDFGRLIEITYRGSFLTGQPMDEMDEVLAFVLGQEGQVIDGLTYGLVGAVPGEKRTIVIPSQFAFGDSGSSTGLIPPFTPLVYEVEVLEQVVQ